MPTSLCGVGRERGREGRCGWWRLGRCLWRGGERRGAGDDTSTGHCARGVCAARQFLIGGHGAAAQQGRRGGGGRGVVESRECGRWTRGEGGVEGVVSLRAATMALNSSGRGGKGPYRGAWSGQGGSGNTLGVQIEAARTTYGANDGHAGVGASWRMQCEDRVERFKVEAKEGKSAHQTVGHWIGCHEAGSTRGRCGATR
mmetsp:Transcript_9253/g.28606  ORF Transcript_9253/g.28606 Transcript_9253/m.28606 type:complete len:200 (+) Transcript_9253:1218-1817(+)